MVPVEPAGVLGMIRLVAFVMMAVASAAQPQAWPDRVGGSRGYLHVYEGTALSWFGRTIGARATGEVWPDAAAVAGFVEHAGIDPSTIEYEQRSSHIAGVFATSRPGDADRYRYAVFVSGQPVNGGRHRLHRTWFRFSAPEQSKGVAVVMPGMLGTPHPIIDRLEETLRGRGWGVLRMLVPPSRSTEHLPVEIDAGDPAQAIKRLAEELDQRTAECAYAVEAALDWLASLGEPFADGPRVLLGISGTGMMLPAVLARNEHAFDAAVVLGGGANAFKILRESSYADTLDSVRVTWAGGAPTAGVLEELDSLYLQYAQLDAYTLAPMIGDVPMLLLHGANDRAVPAETGDLLWKRLGEPTRWSKPVGHELLFVGLALWAGDMMDWLDENATERGG